MVAATSIGVTAVCQRGVARADAPPAATPASGRRHKTCRRYDASKRRQETRRQRHKADETERRNEEPARGNRTRQARRRHGRQGRSDKHSNPRRHPGRTGGSGQSSTEPENFRKLGRVLTPDGEPIAGADVYWDIRRRQSALIDAVPQRLARVETVATTKTNDDGYFAIEAKLVRHDVEYNGLVIRAARLWNQRTGQLLESLEARHALRNPSRTVVAARGHDLLPRRQADRRRAGRRRYRQSRQQTTKRTSTGILLASSEKELAEEHPRPYWPAAVTTNAEGKFRIDDVTPSRSEAELVVQRRTSPERSLPWAIPSRSPTTPAPPTVASRASLLVLETALRRRRAIPG